MNAVGIDVSKGKSMIAIARPLGEIVVKPYEIRHTVDDLKALADALQDLDGETRVILEHTGRYYEPVAQMLHDANIFVSAVNPLLIKDYGNNSLRRVKTDRADSLKIARYGLDNCSELREYNTMDTTRYQLKNIRQLNAISKTVEVFRAEMNRLASLLPEYPVVMDMYGIGESIGPQLMAEIGDVQRFSRKQSLAAFAGIAPTPNQSGTHEAKSTSTSKRGSPHLRRTLFVLMTVLIQKPSAADAVCQFLSKKRAEGKPYYVYMTAGCNKFLRVYFGRVREYLDSLNPADDIAD